MTSVEKFKKSKRTPPTTPHSHTRRPTVPCAGRPDPGTAAHTPQGRGTHLHPPPLPKGVWVATATQRGWPQRRQGSAAPFILLQGETSWTTGSKLPTFSPGTRHTENSARAIQGIGVSREPLGTAVVTGQDTCPYSSDTSEEGSSSSRLVRARLRRLAPALPAR